MTIPTSPTRLQLTQEHYVADLASLLRRYRFGCGSPQCLSDLGSWLETNSALRGDLFNLCTAISHMGESDLSPDEILALVARAAGGPRFVPGESEIPSNTRHTFLSLYEQWSNRVWDEMTPDIEESTPSNAAADETVWQMPVGRFSAAAARTSSRESSDQLADTIARPAITTNTRLGELTIAELRGYLDEIESRVGRLKPYLAPVAVSGVQTGEGLVEFGVLQEEIARVQRAEPADSWGPRSNGNGDQLLAAVPDEQTEHSHVPVLEPAIPFPSIATEPPALPSESLSPEMEMKTLIEPEPVAQEIQRATQNGNIEPVDATDAEPATPLVTVLPVPENSFDAGPSMFRSVSETSPDSSRWFPWIAAAIVLLGAGAGYEYRHLQRQSAAPAATTSSPSATDAPSAPSATPQLETSEPPASQEIAPATEVPAPKPATEARHRRPYSAQPRLLPHEVQMEAEAARAQAEGAATPQNTGADSPPSTRAPIVRSGTGASPASPATDPNQPQ